MNLRNGMRVSVIHAWSDYRRSITLIKRVKDTLIKRNSILLNVSQILCRHLTRWQR